MNATDKIRAYARLARFDRPSGWLLLLWPTLWALWIASDGMPGWRLFLIFLAGVVLSRAAGCCLNDILDRKHDSLVRRTRDRPLPAGDLSVPEAAAFGLALLAVCFTLWLELGPAARTWAIAALAVGATYPLSKRLVHFPQAHLGVAFGMGIPVAYAEVLGKVPATAWMLFFANFFWVLAYDTIYAMADRKDDVKAGIKSMAVWLGERDVVAVSLFYFAAIALLTLHGVATDAALAFYVACALGFGNAFRFVKAIGTRDPGMCLRTFGENHWLGALIMFGLVANSAR